MIHCHARLWDLMNDNHWVIWFDFSGKGGQLSVWISEHLTRGTLRARTSRNVRFYMLAKARLQPLFYDSKTRSRTWQVTLTSPLSSLDRCLLLEATISRARIQRRSSGYWRWSNGMKRIITARQKYPFSMKRTRALGPISPDNLDVTDKQINYCICLLFYHCTPIL
jgi:hypothetical protein